MLDPRSRRRVRRRRQRIIDQKVFQTQRGLLAVVATICWLITAFIFLFVEPRLIKDVPIPGLYLPFFLILLAAIGVSLFALTQHLRRSITIGIGVVLYLYLRVYGLGSWFNLILIVLLCVSFEIIRNPDFLTQLKSLPARIVIGIKKLKPPRKSL